MLVPRAVSFVCLLAPFAGGGRGEREIERSFGSELELTTEAFELTGSEDGRTVEHDAPLFTREQAEELETVDTLLDDEVPPARFERLYRSAMTSQRLAGPGAPRERTASTGLEGKRVRFERDEEGGYARSCDDEDIRRGQLERLRADLSLARFLPAEELEPGASLELPFEPFTVLLSPAGDTRPRQRRLPLPKSGLNLAPAALTEPAWALLAAADGAATLTRTDAGEDGDYPRRAALEFRFEGTYDGSASLESGPSTDAEDEVQVEWKGTGTVEWDPEDGRIRIELDGDLTLEETFTIQVEGNGKTAEVRGKLSCSGSLDLEASEEPGG
jgi:hypothetical protein